MTIKLVFILFNGKDDDDVQEVYYNAEFPEGWDEQSAQRYSEL